MLFNKRQQWILELIKGPDIAPVGNSPGRYSSKKIVEITAEGRRRTIRPSDVFDLNGTDFLTVTADYHTYTIAWESIEELSFREPPGAPAPVLKPEYSRGKSNILTPPLGKRIG